MKETLQKYLLRFSKLRIDRAHGSAPHKPILLLSVLRLFQQEINGDSRIYITPELVALFKANWSLLVETNHDCRFALPFYHLTSDKFWKLVPKAGFENLLAVSSSMRSFSNLNAAVNYAIIEEDLFNLMLEQSSNHILEEFLLDKYFPKTKANYFNLPKTQQRLFDDLEGRILNEDAVDYRNELKVLMEEKNEEEIYLRGSMFKREVPKIYNHTCCISGMKIDATISISMIDACHIIPFSESYDDTITNGIALCPNLHRAFDRGLITIGDNYKVLVSNSFIEDESNYSIKSFLGKEIYLPKNSNHFPAKRNLEWHRRHIFRSIAY